MDANTGIELFGVGLVPLIVGVVWILTTQKWFKQPWAFLADLVLGLGGGFLYVSAQAGASGGPMPPFWWQQSIVLGVSMGLSAAGLYAGMKHLITTSQNGTAGLSYVAKRVAQRVVAPLEYVPGRISPLAEDPTAGHATAPSAPGGLSVEPVDESLRPLPPASSDPPAR